MNRPCGQSFDAIGGSPRSACPNVRSRVASMPMPSGCDHAMTSRLTPKASEPSRQIAASQPGQLRAGRQRLRTSTAVDTAIAIISPKTGHRYRAST